MPEEQKPACANCSNPVTCKECLKGGLPMKNEFSTFLFLFFLGTTIVLGVLFVNAKRQALTTVKPADTTTMENKAAVASFPTELPLDRIYDEPIALPAPKTKGVLSVDAAIAQRRSQREYSDVPVTLQELSQMLWAGQGISDAKTAKRTAPSSYEAYPYTLYVVVRNVTDLEPGLYEYLPTTHALGKLSTEDVGAALTAAGVQDNSQKAPVVIVMSASYGKAAQKLKTGVQSAVLLEGGHIGENLYLEAESLGLGMVTTGGFDSQKVGAALKLDPAETIIYLIPFGHRVPQKTEK
jgi:SagB-type dehydrogenase family enzyme